MFSDFVGKKIVVTGAANGIGKEIAKGCAQRGADVLLVDIHGEEAKKAARDLSSHGTTVEYLQADVSLPEECQKILDYTLEKFGRCDMLVNNAGVSTGADIWDIPERDIQWVTEVNVYSHWYMMKRFIPVMRSQKSHCQILNVCSIAGLITLGSAPAYFSTKHAAVALSEVAYKSLKAAGDDIDVSVFCPGFIQTEMYLTDRHRPDRYAIAPDDPYYQSEDYKKFIAFNKQILDNGAPLVPTIEKVFAQLKEGNFFILTHDQYDRLLRKQGEFQANKKFPIDPAMLKQE